MTDHQNKSGQNKRAESHLKLDTGMGTASNFNVGLLCT